MIVQLFSLFDKYIDFKLVILIIVASYWAKKFLTANAPFVSMAWRVLIFSTVITILYYLLLRKTGVFEVEDIPVYFISYFTATSFYELGFVPLERFVKKLFGARIDPEDRFTEPERPEVGNAKAEGGEKGEEVRP